MFNDYNKKRSFYHAAMIALGAKIGSDKGEKDLRALLLEYGSLEDAFFSQNVDVNDKRLNLIKKKLDKYDEEFAVLTINDEFFPRHLKQIEYATPVLYVKGNISLLDDMSIAVVGTRELEEKVIPDGKECLGRLLDQGYTIVSGLARGCDTLAHRYAVENEGRTIAVLGTPLDKGGIVENKDLEEEIAKNHLLVTQYPIGARTFASHFAHRNKTTVGLAKEGVIVIQAGDRSGTMHAVKECKKQEKFLYALAANKGQSWVSKYKPLIVDRKK